MTTQEQKIRYLKKFPLTGDEEQADWWLTQREEELKELVGMIKSYDRFKCVACENKVSKLSHTQFCIFRDEILSLINNKLK